MNFHVHVVGLIFFLQLLLSGYCYQWKTLFYKQPVDHFGFANQDTFLQRYLINNTFWKQSGGPIFLYTGNEGDIEWFAENTGFMWDLAPEFGAMLLFAEHRYYGHSLPYGNKSYTDPKYLGYLSSEQALADFAELTTYIKSTIPGASKSPVVAFGGSYGGMLSAWMRLKYPHIVVGAIAASAPVLQFTDLTPCDAFSRVVTADFATASAECANSIRKSWKAIDRVVANSEGMKWLSSNWRLCNSLNSSDDIKKLKDWLTNVWTNLAMVDYPYPANFLAPLPAYPVKVVCEKIVNSSLEDYPLLLEIFQGLSIYTNYTGLTNCVNINQQADESLGDLGWDFQSCTEMVMPMCSDGINDMFEPSPWNLQEWSDNCFKRWKVRPRAKMAPIVYGGKDITSSSNIIFSNGLLDPWSTGGITKSLSDSLVAIIIPEGAHHIDLRNSNQNDPLSVIKARDLEKQFIKKWITERKRKEIKPTIIL